MASIAELKEAAREGLRREIATQILGDCLRGPFAYLLDNAEELADKSVKLADALLKRLELPS